MKIEVGRSRRKWAEKKGFFKREANVQKEAV